LSTILGGLGSIVSSAFDLLTAPFKKTWDFVSGLFSSEDSGILGSISDGLGSIASSGLDLLTSPFEKTWDFVSGLFSSEDSGIMGSMLDGLKSGGSSIIDTLTSPFKAVTDFVSNIFGGDGSIGETIINGIKSVMSVVFDLLVSPFKSAFDFVKKIPFVGKLFGGGDATASVNDKAKADVEKQVSMVVEIKNLDALKETIDKLVEAISKLGGTAGGASSVVNVDNNQNAMIQKLDELINLLREGAIAVNMDGTLVSKTLAKLS
jgi:phage-related protein